MTNGISHMTRGYRFMIDSFACRSSRWVDSCAHGYFRSTDHWILGIERWTESPKDSISNVKHTKKLDFVMIAVGLATHDAWTLAA